MTPSGEDTYLFRHALTRQAAYDLLPPSDRARLHELAAASLDAQEGESATPEIADHLGLALAWWRGDRAAAA
jgi:predicted ATPase